MHHSASSLRALRSAIAAGSLLGCSTIFNTAMVHLVQPHVGPCAGAMDSVRNVRGAPARKEYDDTEDLDTKQQQVEHRWYYTAVADSSAVVRFSWERAGYDCAVVEEPFTAPPSSPLLESTDSALVRRRDAGCCDGTYSHSTSRPGMCTHHAARSRGRLTFLNLDAPYRNQLFTVVIWGEARPNFPEAPQSGSGASESASPD